MDTKQLIKDAKTRFDHNTAKQLLKEKYQAKLLVANQGGLWKATPELIGYLKLNQHEKVIVTDIYDNPTLVIRLQLLNSLIETYEKTMQEWLADFEELKKNR